MLLPPGECVGNAHFWSNGGRPAELPPRAFGRERIVAAEGVHGVRQLHRHRIPMRESRNAGQRSKRRPRDGQRNRTYRERASPNRSSPTAPCRQPSRENRWRDCTRARQHSRIVRRVRHRPQRPTRGRATSSSDHARTAGRRPCASRGRSAARAGGRAVRRSWVAELP